MTCTAKMAGVVATALALASCGTPPAAERDRETPASKPAAASADGPPPNAAKASGAPAATDLPLLTPEGLGPLRIGMTQSELTAALGPDSDPAAVGGADPKQCDQFRPARAPQGVLVMMENGRLTRISLIDKSPIRTDRGVGLGSTATAVRGAYKRTVVASPHKYRDAPSEYLSHWSRKAQAGDKASATDRGIVFEVDGKGVVDLIHAGGPSIRYVEGCA